MKIIEIARQNREILNEGIAYVAVWQQAQTNGRKSWLSEDFFPTDSDENDVWFSDDDKARFAEIAALDPDAVLLNGYYHSWIGSMDEPLNATQISAGLKKHYEMHSYLIKDYLGGDDVPTMITIELPAANANEDVLRALIESKATLIKSALGDDGLGELLIIFEGDKIAFNWLKFGTDSDAIKAWSAFLSAACKFSKTAKRVTAKDKAVENEKFAFRTFLVKIGMNDASNKDYRRQLLRNLSGDAAFATAESRAKWQAKHLKNAEATNN